MPNGLASCPRFGITHTNFIKWEWYCRNWMVSLLYTNDGRSHSSVAMVNSFNSSHLCYSNGQIQTQMLIYTCHIMPQGSDSVHESKLGPAMNFNGTRMFVLCTKAETLRRYSKGSRLTSGLNSITKCRPEGLRSTELVRFDTIADSGVDDADAGRCHRKSSTRKKDSHCCHWHAACAKLSPASSVQRGATCCRLPCSGGDERNCHWCHSAVCRPSRLSSRGLHGFRTPPEFRASAVTAKRR